MLATARTYLSLVRFSHTVFALPFALLSAALAWKDEPFRWQDLLGIVLCMVFARSAAMAFNRPVLIERSDTAGQWQVVAGGTILRAPDGAADRAWLTVDFPESAARNWRVTVDNRNDAPIAGLRPTLLTAVRRVVLKQEPGAAYRLVYGNPRGRPAHYDMAQLADRKALDAAEPATLGPEEINRSWVDPSPWTEKHDTALWVALVVAVGVLGAVAVRTLRTMKT